MAYKKNDEDAHRKAQNIEADKAAGKKNLMDKFGFSDDEDTNILI